MARKVVKEIAKAMDIGHDTPREIYGKFTLGILCYEWILIEKMQKILDLMKGGEDGGQGKEIWAEPQQEKEVEKEPDGQNHHLAVVESNYFKAGV